MIKVITISIRICAIDRCSLAQSCSALKSSCALSADIFYIFCRFVRSSNREISSLIEIACLNNRIRTIFRLTEKTSTIFPNNSCIIMTILSSIAGVVGNIIEVFLISPFIEEFYKWFRGDKCSILFVENSAISWWNIGIIRWTCR